MTDQPDDSHGPSDQRPRAADRLRRRRAQRRESDARQRQYWNNVAHRVLSGVGSDSEEEALRCELEPVAENVIAKTKTSLFGPRSRPPQSTPGKSDGWSIAGQAIDECRRKQKWHLAEKPPMAYLIGVVRNTTFNEVRTAQGGLDEVVTSDGRSVKVPRLDPPSEPVEGLSPPSDLATSSGSQAGSSYGGRFVDEIVARLSQEEMLEVLKPAERRAIRVALEAEERGVDEQDVAAEHAVSATSHRQNKSRAVRKLLEKHYGLSDDQLQAYLVGRQVATLDVVKQPDAGSAELTTRLGRLVSTDDYVNLLRTAQNTIYRHEYED